MHTLLVTLLGPGQRVDLQLPADIPVGKLLPELLAQCNPQALDGRSTDHAPWTLALAESGTSLDKHLSLSDAGVGNGATLVLRHVSPQSPQPVPQMDHEKYVPAPRLALPLRQVSIHTPVPSPERHPVSITPQRAPGPKSVHTFHIPVRDYPPGLPTEEIVITSPPQLSSSTGKATIVLQFLVACSGGSWWIAFFSDLLCQW